MDVGTMHQSDIGLYLTCPMQFFLRKKLRQPEPGRHPNAVTGSALHWAIEIWHKHGQKLMDRQFCDNFFLHYFHETIKGNDPMTLAHKEGPIPPVMWEWGKHDQDHLLSDAQTVFYNYTGQEHNLNANVLMTESEFDVTYYRTHYAGSVDQIRIADDGTLELWDFKFSSFKPGQSYLDRGYQFTLYAFAMLRGSFFSLPDDPDCNEIYHTQIGELPARCVWYHLPNLLPYKRNTGTAKKGDLRGDPRIFTYRDSNTVKFGMKNIRKIVSQIRRDVFPMAPRVSGSCNAFCHLHDACKNIEEGLPADTQRQAGEAALYDFFNETAII
ncbi:MAG: PD-(D/E)XK nuclease family protein [candidate division KSB1 bacterium]|nr:PD-(D/E)XK nuclease family protein [candidate division KSB1 bacterium]